MEPSLGTGELISVPKTPAWQPDASSVLNLTVWPRTVIPHIVWMLTLCSLNGWQIPSEYTAGIMSPLPSIKLRTKSQILESCVGGKNFLQKLLFADLPILFCF